MRPEYMGFKVLARAHRKEGGNVKSMTKSKAYLHSYDHIKRIETRKGGWVTPLCPFGYSKINHMHIL